MNNFVKNWIKSKPSKKPIERSPVSLTTWRDWTYILNEDPPEQTIKQRRNLLLSSAFSWLLWYGNVDVGTMQILGVNLKTSELNLVYLSAIISQIYFLTTFVVTTITDFIDKNISRYRSVLKGDFWEENHLKSMEIQLAMYEKIIEMMLKAGMHDTKNYKGFEFDKSYIESVVNEAMQKNTTTEDAETYRLEAELLDKLHANLTVTWLKITFNYILPIVIGIYCLYKLISYN